MIILTWKCWEKMHSLPLVLLVSSRWWQDQWGLRLAALGGTQVAFHDGALLADEPEVRLWSRYLGACDAWWVTVIGLGSFWKNLCRPLADFTPRRYSWVGDSSDSSQNDLQSSCELKVNHLASGMEIQRLELTWGGEAGAAAAVAGWSTMGWEDGPQNALTTEADFWLRCAGSWEFAAHFPAWPHGSSSLWLRMEVRFVDCWLGNGMSECCWCE